MVGGWSAMARRLWAILRNLRLWRWVTFQEVACRAEYPPPWWGMALHCLYSDRRLFVLIPFNLLVRGAIRAWRWVRYDVSEFEKRIWVIWQDGYQKGRQVEHDRQQRAKMVFFNQSGDIEKWP